MKSSTRDALLERIRLNITTHGHHIHLIVGGALPRFAYTIGASQMVGVELILAGASFYSTEDVKHIINESVERLKAENTRNQLDIGALGVFSLCKVNTSWANQLMLGALDFYDIKNIPALQLVPDHIHWTIDIPNMNQFWDASSQPIWQWLYDPWQYTVSEQSVAVTNLDALRGESITEVMRWEENQWELFAGAGPDVAREDIRKVSLGTLLAADQSLHVITDLKVGQGLWRDPIELKWNPWGN